LHPRAPRGATRMRRGKDAVFPKEEAFLGHVRSAWSPLRGSASLPRRVSSERVGSRRPGLSASRNSRCRTRSAPTIRPNSASPPRSSDRLCRSSHGPPPAAAVSVPALFTQPQPCPETADERSAKPLKSGYPQRPASGSFCREPPACSTIHEPPFQSVW
jgi:hypothetical protein